MEFFREYLARQPAAEVVGEASADDQGECGRLVDAGQQHRSPGEAGTGALSGSEFLGMQVEGAAFGQHCARFGASQAKGCLSAADIVDCGVLSGERRFEFAAQCAGFFGAGFHQPFIRAQPIDPVLAASERIRRQG